METLKKDGKRLNQHIPEWKAYLELAAGYFKARAISRPVVVEIGILDGAQRRFYEQILGAEYVGIDVNPKAPADIHGDSTAPGTLAKLNARLAGRPIDLLFIDGLHTYAGVKADYEIYGPLVRHIIAIHDIHTPKLTPADSVDVARLWNEILATNTTDTIITIQRHNPRRPEEFNGRPLGIGIIVKDAPEEVNPAQGSPQAAKAPEKCAGRIGEASQGRPLKVSVISRWMNEEFFAPYFLSHYAFADEIIILLERSTSDRSAEIIGRFPNARIEYTDTGGVINDRIFSDAMSDLAASLKTDWVIRADADELIYFEPQFWNPRGVLAEADGNCIEVLFRWIFRHKDDPDLDPSKPAVFQRPHGGVYSMWPGMGSTFIKPSIVRPEAKIRWRPGEQGYENSPNVRMSEARADGVHWQMVDVEEAVRRLLSAEARLSDVNKKNNWGVRRFTEAQIRECCAAHLNDPVVI
jgi:hypothetical protein